MTSASGGTNGSLEPRREREGAGDDAARRPTRTWSLWLAAGGAAALVVALAGLVLLGGMLSTSPAPEQDVPAVTVIEPSGTLDAPPRSLRWRPVPEATSYIVTAEREGSGDVVFHRASASAGLELKPGELALLGPGSYRWTVEGRSGTGRVLARGEAWFRVLGSR